MWTELPSTPRLSLDTETPPTTTKCDSIVDENKQTTDADVPQGVVGWEIGQRIGGFTSIGWWLHQMCGCVGKCACVYGFDLKIERVIVSVENGFYVIRIIGLTLSCWSWFAHWVILCMIAKTKMVLEQTKSICCLQKECKRCKNQNCLIDNFYTSICIYKVPHWIETLHYEPN